MIDDGSTVLAIDFGTTATAAAVAVRGQVRAVSFGQLNWLSSAVFRRADDGRLVVGSEADRRAAVDPLAYDPTPKRRVGQGAVDLGGARVTDVELVAAVVSTVAAEAERQYPGITAGPVVLTHPARWAADRRAVLTAAAQRSGLGHARLLSEPVAAAVHHGALGRDDGRPTVCCVYDLGGGTFDVAVVTDEDGAVALSGPPGGIDPLGGVDFDHLLLEHLGTRLAGRDPDGWHRLTHPTDARSRTDRRALLQEVRAAKEELSVGPSATVFAPGIDPDAAELMVTRAELEALLRPQLHRTVQAVRDTLQAARTDPTDLTALVLTGGSSRIPAVADLLWRELGIVPTTQDDPKLVVALGAVSAQRLGLLDDERRPTPPVPPGPGPQPPVVVPESKPSEPHPFRTDDPSSHLSPATRLLLTAQPALATALAGHPLGVAQIDDEAVLVALMCAPGLLEQVIQDPTTLDRLRDQQGVQFVSPDALPEDGSPLPVRVLFAGEPRWSAAFSDPDVRQASIDDGPTNWALRTIRTLNTATEAERVALLDDPRWNLWVAMPSYPDWIFQDGESESVTIDLSTAVPPAVNVIPEGDVERPVAPSPQQRRLLADLATLYEPVPDKGIHRGRWKGPLDLMVEVFGRPSSEWSLQLILPQDRFPATCLVWPAVGGRPGAAIVLTRGGAGWYGFPLILTADVVQSVQYKMPLRFSNRIENMGRRVVVRTTVRPGATCPPSGAQFDLRTTHAEALAQALRTVLGVG